jgi:hypothetical protein
MWETAAKFRLYAGKVKYNTQIEGLIRIGIIICIILPPIIIIIEQIIKEFDSQPR